MKTKKLLALLLAILMLAIPFASMTVFADDAVTQSKPSDDIADGIYGLYAHAVSGSSDTQAWQMWQTKHDEDFYEVNPTVKYFFLPSSVKNNKVDIYNNYSQPVTVNGTEIPSHQTATVSFETGVKYEVKAPGENCSLVFMMSSAQAAVYVNNANADGNGMDLMQYLNMDKSNSATAEGAIVDADGSVNNTAIKKIKGRGNTTWWKAKKPYNITYTDNVSVAGMHKSKKYSLLANYQDDSLSRNRFLYDLSDAVGLPYASDSRYVDFYANGFYWGSYQMTEKVEVGKNNVVNDIDDTAYLNADGTVNADFPFLCEVDSGANPDEDFVVDCDNGINLTIKAPELAPTDACYDEVKNYIREKYNAFASAAKSNNSDLSQYCDIDSVTKLYLINELGKNWDSGVSSLYFVYKQAADGNYKFFGSPVWDYDNSLGNATGVEWELANIGVRDYEEYSGWWCKYKGKSKRSKSTSNIMNNLANNAQILEAAPQIWFEKFVPAIDYFAGKTSVSTTADEFYSAEKYYSLLKGSADMNYASGWNINTGSWISDHSKLRPAKFDMSTGTYSVSNIDTNYNEDFDGMYGYCRDWLTSRAAWLSSQMFPNYTPPVKVTGDIDGNGYLTVKDATAIQKHLVGLLVLSDEKRAEADVNHDKELSVKDATLILKVIVGLSEFPTV